MVTPARPLASGRNCDVFALADGRVVRSYKDGRSAEDEAELIRAVHTLGYPVPRVDEWNGPRIVMDRIEGPTLWEQLFGGAVDADEGALILAGVALTLGFLGARDLLTAYGAAAPAPYAEHLEEAARIRSSKPRTTVEERAVMAQAVQLARDAHA